MESKILSNDDQAITQPMLPKTRRRKQKPVADEQLPEAERLRRERQRQLRLLALQAQAQGIPWKKNKRQLQQQQDGAESRPAKKAKHDKKPRKPRAALQVVVLPIYWKIKTTEANAVVATAEKLKEQLAEAGLQVHLDNDNHKTPGQKMHHWESKGVKVRVEIGPQDVGKGRCIVAVARKPGQVAIKTTVATAEVVERVSAALEQAAAAGTAEAEAATSDEEMVDEAAGRASGDASTSGRGRNPEQEGEQKAKQRKRRGTEDAGGGEGVAQHEGAVKKKGKRKEKDQVDASDGAGVVDTVTEVVGAAGQHVEGPAAGEAAAQQASAYGLQQPPVVSGDALEDDFDIEVDAEEDKVLGNKGRREKFKKMRKDKKRSKAAAGSQHVHEAGTNGNAAGKPAVKLVKF